MPLPNRVTPFGAMEASPARGLFMGNRGGRFHDPATKAIPGRPFATRRWIICALDFKERRRLPWSEGYTELFFCDEVTALAAGHRPCMECRRAQALLFRRSAFEGGAFASLPSCPELDAALHAERPGPPRCAEAASLPEGAMVAIGGRAFAMRDGRLAPWSQRGYGAPIAAPAGPVEVLTPPASLAALRAGYAPIWSAL
jgi:hypothetical protein